MNEVSYHFLTDNEKFFMGLAIIAITVMTFLHLMTAWCHNATLEDREKARAERDRIAQHRLDEIEKRLISANEMSSDSCRDIATISEDARKIKKAVKESACQRKGPSA